MKAWIPQLCDAQLQLRLADVPQPTPAPGELLVRVRALGLNRAEMKLVAPSGASPQPPGLEMAGEVVAVGPDVVGFEVDDRVMGLCSGSYAEYVVANQRRLMRVPGTMDWATAASLPLSVLTAYDALSSAGIAPGAVVYVNAASSGVGVMSWQIAQALGAHAVVGSSTAARKLRVLSALGLQHPVEAAPEAVKSLVDEVSGGKGADILVDFVGGPQIGLHVDLAAIGARWVSVGRLGGLQGEIDLDRVSYKRMHLIGATFRTRSHDDVSRIIAGATRDVLPLLSSGAIRYPIAARFAFPEMLAAREAMRNNQQVGKIVVTH